ncbi:MAG: EamA family transporter [Phyllobacteriaceae bacterium]|nr:EamA family transporter [Phyllobacteriaceae bacterium]MBA91975.1 EamA family transporter [Phyllobacteriaceae bacterium]
MTRIRANLLLLTSGAIWGMGFVAQSTAMENIGPWLFIGLRFVLATLAMLPLALREARRSETPLTPADWRAFMLTGLFFFAGMGAQQLGLQTTSVTNAGFLTGLYVVFTPFLAIALFRQWPHPVIWPAAALAMTGIWYLSGGRLESLTPGDWLTVLCALFWAMQVTLTGRYAASSGRPVALAVTQFALSAVLGLAFAIAMEPWDMAAIGLAAPEILYAGVFAGGIAFTIQAVAQRHTTAPQAAIFLSSEAVFAAILGALLLGERLGFQGYAGCALMLAAMLAVEIVPAIKRRKPA